MWHIVLILCMRLLRTYAENTTCHTMFTFQQVCLDSDHGVPIQTYNNIESAIACSELCFRDQTCRSVQFLPVNKQCLTNKRTRANVSSSCHNKIRYGTVQKFACRPYWMFDPCSTNGDCPIANSKCRSYRCECKDGYAYDYRFDSCVTGCAQYGNSLHEVSYAVHEYDNHNTDGGTLEQCQNLCLSNPGFVCRYIEYYGDQSHCYLSEESAITVPQTAISYHQNNPLSKFFDRNCA